MSEEKHQIHPGLKSIFDYQGWCVNLGWLLLVVGLFWPPALIAVTLIVVLLCCLYVYLLLQGHRYEHVPQKLDVKSFFSARGVITMMKNDKNAFIVWTHILVFDMAIGLVIALDSQTTNIPSLLIIPVLFATLMFGPSGLLLYFVLKLAFAADLSAFGLG